ncbi:hypothetical protein [Yinghuangia soli]|uniref:Uncharacterized protein n=1 Tax=Yinghuangia soli TaxID=2908204 RepID=A0AA41PYT5_9ACTN|nr:hypothetical protein [Yinghuangia soli]MCF2528424.1 hypothetical protein [Yinghuangia soli]
MGLDISALQVLIRRHQGQPVRDQLTGNIGHLMDVIGDAAWLRPVRGGVEWSTPLARVVSLDGDPIHDGGQSDHASANGESART